MVDGNWRFSPEHPTMPDENGITNNYTDTRNYVPLLKNQEAEKKKKDEEESGRIYHEEHKKSFYDRPNMPGHPPKLPQHYEKCLYLAQNMINNSSPELYQKIMHN